MPSDRREVLGISRRQAIIAAIREWVAGTDKLNRAVAEAAEANREITTALKTAATQTTPEETR